MLDGCFQLGFIGPGGPELLVIMLVLIMVFGAKDAPKIFRKINEMLNSVRNTADGFKREIMYGDLDNDSSSEEAYTVDEDEYEEYHDDDFDYTGEDEERDYSDETFQSLEDDLEEAHPASDSTPETGDEEDDDAKQA